MKENTKSTGNAIGLDIGTSRIVVARKRDEDIQFQAQLNAFVNVPYSKLTEGVLKKEHIPYTVQDSQIVVHGDESEKFADMLKVDLRRPMTRGVLNPHETDSLDRIGQIVRLLVGEANTEASRVCFSTPAAPLGEEENLTYHETSLRQILEGLGFKVTSINEGLAVVYSELESSNYTGIGISCGGGLCNVCLAYLSVPILSFSLPKAGDFIDNSAAAVTGELATTVRMTKEGSFQFNGHFSDKMHQVLGVYYDDMIQTLVGGLKEALSTCRTLPKAGRPIPLVLSGGSALPGGFRDRFEKTIRESNFPIELSSIRLAKSPLHTTAHGTLIAALVEQ